LIAAIERAEAAGYDIRVAGAGRLPRVETFGTGGYQNFLGTLGGAPGSPTGPDQVATSAQAGVRLTLPLFQGGRVAAQRRQAQARASVALEQVVAAERNVISQVRAAYSSWQASLAIIS